MVKTVKAGGTADYTGLKNAILRVAGFYACGVIASFVQARLMIYVTQGSLKELRMDLFNHMESLPIKRDDPGVRRIRYTVQYRCDTCRSASPLTMLEIDLSNHMFGKMPPDDEIIEMLKMSAAEYARMRAK